MSLMVVSHYCCPLVSTPLLFMSGLVRCDISESNVNIFIQGGQTEQQFFVSIDMVLKFFLVLVDVTFFASEI